MSDKALLEYFTRSTQDVCDNFAPDQLNKELKANTPRRKFSLAYVWNIIAATLFLTKTYAQGKPVVRKPESVNTVQNGKAGNKFNAGMLLPIVLKGKVVNEKNGEPVNGASIMIRNTSNGTNATAAGDFSLPVHKGQLLIVEVSCIGYEKQELPVDAIADWNNVQVLLKPAAGSLPEVVVTSLGVMGRLRRHLPFSMVKKVKINLYDSLQKSIGVFPEHIRLFPNPVMRGNAVNVNIKLKQAGAYKLELLNNAGHVLLIQPLIMQTREQLIDLHTQAGWSAGVYYVRVSAPGTKNVYHTKLIIR